MRDKISQAQGLINDLTESDKKDKEDLKDEKELLQKIENFVDGFDADAASAGDYAATPAASAPVIVPAADTLDILVAAQTGTTLTGKFRVFATLMDISGQAGLGADEVDRDTLA